MLVQDRIVRQVEGVTAMGGGRDRGPELHRIADGPWCDRNENSKSSGSYPSPLLHRERCTPPHHEPSERRRTTKHGDPHTEPEHQRLKTPSVLTLIAIPQPPPP